MKLKSISLKNFFGHQSTELDLTKTSSPMLIVGSNGAGKSSLFLESLAFCIFGKTRIDNTDSAIYNDAEEMSVACSFEIDGQDIRIERSKRRGKSQKLSFFLEDIRVDELLTETQARIDKVFGISYEAFTSSTFLQQDQAHTFINKSADERKQIIGEILNLSLYEKYEEIIKTKRSEVKGSLKEGQAVLESISILDTQSLESDLKRIEKIVLSFKNNIQSLEKELEDVVKWNSLVKEKNQTYENIKIQNEKAKQAIDKAGISLQDKKDILVACKKILTKKVNKKEIESLEVAIGKAEERMALAQDAITDNQKEYNQVLNVEVEKVNDLLNAITGESAKLESSIDGLTQKINRLSKVSDAQCPTCLRDLSKAEKDTMLKELQQELKPLSKKFEEYASAISGLQKDRTAIRNGDFKACITINQNILKANDILASEKAKWEDSRTNLKRLQSDLQSYNLAAEKQSTIMDMITELETSIEVLQGQIQPLPEKSVEFKEEAPIKANLKEKQSSYQDAIEIKTKLTIDIEQAKTNKQKREALLEELKEAKGELDILERLVFAFSRKGLPAKIIAQSLPDIESFANVFLEKISNGNLTIKFTTIQQLKSGEERETLEILVSDGVTTRPFSSYSGGEALRISLALRLALSRFLTYRQGSSKIDMLIIDEPSGLDAEGLEQFATALKKLKDMFSLIVVITHLQDLQAQFDNIIQLQKTADGISLA